MNDDRIICVYCKRRVSYEVVGHQIWTLCGECGRHNYLTGLKEEEMNMVMNFGDSKIYNHDSWFGIALFVACATAVAVGVIMCVVCFVTG